MVTQPGAKNPNWKGGRTIASNGYVLIRVGVDHHLSDVRGYAYEHRLVAEEKIGRRLRPGEVAHHIDGVKTNNDPANIEVVENRRAHAFHHREPNSNKRQLDEPNRYIWCGCGCGQTFRQFDSKNRPRLFISGHNLDSANG